MSSRTSPAWLSLSNNSRATIEWCLSGIRPTEFFTVRLGLPHKEVLAAEKGKKKGKPKFEGQVAPQCDRLHKMIMESVQCIADKYHTKEELETAVKLQHDLSIAETTMPLLLHVGPVIWNESEPYQTNILPPQYPRHLKFENKNDLDTIMLYVYCWIVGRVARVWANRREYRSTRRTRDVSMSSSEDEYQDEFDASGHSDKYLASLFDNGQPGPNMYGRRINNPSVPVASMLPVASNKTTSSTRPGVTPPVAEESSPAVGSKHRSNALDDGDESGTFKPGRPANPRGIKRRGHSTIDTPLNKKVAKAKQASPTSALITRRKAREFSAEGDASNASYPSSPLVQPDELDEAPNGRNFPNIHSGGSNDRSKATVANSTSHPHTGTTAPNQHSEPNSHSPAKENGSTPATARKSAASDNEDHDNDSVQGLEVSRAETTPECHDNDYDRQRLAVELYDVLFGKLQKLDLVAVESTLELLESLYKASRMRLANVSVANPGRYQDSFAQWLTCFRLVVQYCKDTKFTGNLSELRAFKKTMPRDLAKSTTRSLVRGSWALLKWRHENKIDNNSFAKQVASVLFQVGVWTIHMELQDVEELTLDFTEELLAWFK